MDPNPLEKKQSNNGGKIEISNLELSNKIKELKTGEAGSEETMHPTHDELDAAHQAMEQEVKERAQYVADRLGHVLANISADAWLNSTDIEAYGHELGLQPDTKVLTRVIRFENTQSGSEHSDVRHQSLVLTPEQAQLLEFVFGLPDNDKKALLADPAVPDIAKKALQTGLSDFEPTKDGLIGRSIDQGKNTYTDFGQSIGPRTRSEALAFQGGEVANAPSFANFSEDERDAIEAGADGYFVSSKVMELKDLQQDRSAYLQSSRLDNKKIAA